jgi:hypothetical protein
MLKLLWIGTCTLVGAAMGAALLGLHFKSVPLAIVGAVVGAGLGALFGRFVPLSDFILHMFD